LVFFEAPSGGCSYEAATGIFESSPPVATPQRRRRDTADVSPRSRKIGWGTAALLIVAGALCAVFVSGLTGELLVIGLMSSGFLVAVALVFLEVGFGEERELEREAEGRRARVKRRLALRRGSPPKRRPD
jgi:hypothetical protein